MYAPSLAYLIAMVSAYIVPTTATSSRRRCAWTTWSARSPSTARWASSALIWVGIFAAGYPTGVNNVDSSIWGQLLGLATFLPLGFLSGWVASFVMKKLNILRVPPEVELMGLDVAEYEQDLYLPEMTSPGERIVEPDGTHVDAHKVLQAAKDEVVV